MEQSFSFQWSDDFARTAVVRYIWRRAGLALLLNVLVMVGGVIALVKEPSQGVWWVLVVVPFVYLSVWTRYYFKAVSRVRKLGNPLCTVQLSDEGLTFQSDLSTSTVKWPAVTQVWTFSDTLILFSHEQVIAMLPATAIGGDLRLMIEEKVRHQGGRVQ